MILLFNDIDITIQSYYFISVLTNKNIIHSYHNTNLHVTTYEIILLTLLNKGQI